MAALGGVDRRKDGMDLWFRYHLSQEQPAGPVKPKQGTVTRYMLAVRKWIAAGRPKRSDDEVQEILAVCAECKSFDGKRCAICKCHINDKRSAMLNKARMATEHCPEGKW